MYNQKLRQLLWAARSMVKESESLVNVAQTAIFSVHHTVESTRDLLDETARWRKLQPRTSND